MEKIFVFSPPLRFIKYACKQFLKNKNLFLLNFQYFKIKFEFLLANLRCFWKSPNFFSNKIWSCTFNTLLLHITLWYYNTITQSSSFKYFSFVFIVEIEIYFFLYFVIWFLYSDQYLLFMLKSLFVFANELNFGLQV